MRNSNLCPVPLTLIFSGVGFEKENERGVRVCHTQPALRVACLTLSAPGHARGGGPMATPGVLKKEKTVAQFELDDADMKRVDNSHPTKVMREELEALGIALPDPEEQLRLSKLFNEKLEIWRFEEHKGVSVSWFNLFAEIDEDGSGYVTFDEVRNVCSQKLKLSSSLPVLARKRA